MITLPFKLLILTFYLSHTHTKMLRNDALISKMVMDFQKDKQSPTEARRGDTAQPKNVLSLMQNVLCRNFPTIPCDMIIKDDKLRKLIEKSIQQIKYKKLSMDKTTLAPEYLTLFPVINSEDISNFLQESDNGHYKQQKGGKNKHTKKSRSKAIEKVKMVKSTFEPQRSLIYSRKKIRKFYPHKIKYKDKRSKAFGQDFGDYSDDKVSMSVETPANPPVWRIDYMKHGDPSINSMFGYDTDIFKTKMTKTGSNLVREDNVVEARKDVLHPDVYIKKNFYKKNSLDSDGLD